VFAPPSETIVTDHSSISSLLQNTATTMTPPVALPEGV
jgi:hypothetical protein